ncbi:MAG: hypothetical protein JWN80_19 [Microbacteriaceae bacterium]|nr:hypothetical protein [Microbacteriaceae bacterium]
MSAAGRVEPVETSPTKKKRHRGRTALVVLAIIAVLLIVGGVILDNVARSYAENLVQTKVRSALSVPASTPVDVKVEGTSVLYQLATGRLQKIDVTLPKVSIGALTGSAKLAVDGVPVDQSQPIDGGTLVVSTDQAGLRELLKSFSGIPVTSVDLVGGAVRLGGSFDIFGLKIPLTVTLTPGVKDGKLTLAPKAFELNGSSITAAQLAKSFGGLASGITGTQSLCIASALPKPLHLKSLVIKGTTVTVAGTISPVVLNATAFTTKGTC